MLAADLAVVELAPVEIAEPEMCQVAELEVQSDVGGQAETGEQAEVLDLDLTEIPVDVIDSETADPLPEAKAEIDVDEATETLAHDLGDPVDGTDGFFGSIDADNPSQSFAFSPTEDGMIDIVVASSFGDAETRLAVSNSGGDVVASTMTEQLDGFQTLSFEGEAGEAYQLTVGSEDGAEGYFQVTVEHNEIPEPIDLHVDTIGVDSTELDFVDDVTDVSGELELAGDVDTFRFTADSNGQIALGLAELNSENATELQVQVLNVDGEAITRGITNENVGISFDVEAGSEYFIAINAGEGQDGSYRLDVSLEADVIEPEVEPVVDQDLEPISEPVVGEDVDGDAVNAEVVNEEVVNQEVVNEGVVDEDIVDEDIVDEDIVDEGAVGEGAVGEDVVDAEECLDEEIVDEVAAEFTELEFVDGVATATGDLEAGIEGDSFQFVAPADGEVSLELTATSEGNAADAAVAVLDANNDPVVDGSTNDDVGVLFDVVEGGQYSVSVDSLNDVPASYELTALLTISETEDVSPADDLVDPVDESIDSDVAEVGNSIDDLIDEEREVCFTDLESENEVVDSFFAEFNPDSIFQMDRGFEIRRS